MATTTVSEILGREAVPLRVEHAGRAYEARPCSLEFMSAVERHLAERDKRPALDLAGDVEPAVLAALLREHLEKVKAKAFRWAGPEHLAWLATPEGGVEFAALVFGVDADTILGLMAHKAAEVTQVVEQVLVESLPPAVLDAVAAARRDRPPTPAPQA